MKDIDIDDAPATEFRVRALAWKSFRAKVEEEWCGPPGCSAGHARMIRWVVGELEALNLAVEGEEPRTIASTADLTTGLVRRFVATRRPDLSPFTLRTYLSCLRCICSLAFQHRWIAVSPFHLKKMSRWVRTGRPQGKRTLTRLEVRKLLDVLQADVASRKGWALWKARRLQIAVVIALAAGLRRNELLRLQVADIDLDGRLIHVRPHGKSLKTERSEDSVPFPDAIVPVLEEWLRSWRLAAPEGYPVDPACPWLIPTANRKSCWVDGSSQSRAFNMLRLAGDKAGLDGLNWQTLRRTCASRLEAAGVPGLIIARILRHSVQVDEMFYRQRDAEAMKDAMKDMEL